MRGKKTGKLLRLMRASHLSEGRAAYATRHNIEQFQRPRTHESAKVRAVNVLNAFRKGYIS